MWNLSHVGSTSVEGLAAKPVIDIIAAVKNVSLFIKQVKELGYEARGETGLPFREYFRKNKVINLHVYENYSPEVELNLAFRDYLRKHKDACMAYQELKYKLANNENASQKETSIYTHYNLGKDAFIRQVLKQTGFNKLRLMFVNHYLEQEQFNELYKNCLASSTYKGREVKFVLYLGVEIVAATRVFIFNDIVKINEVVAKELNSEVNAEYEITKLVYK